MAKTTNTKPTGGAQVINIGAAQSLTVGGGQTIQVGKSRKTAIGKDDALDVGKDWKVVSGGRILLQAAQEIRIAVGAASLVLKANGDIQLRGNRISIEGSAEVHLKGATVHTN